ncbi:MAG: acyltransferase domain-containing protein [Okeania sp. SIO3H1]|nr:acyltransferase domain-containing protein [Okeania sp. SIO3H1]
MNQMTTTNIDSSAIAIIGISGRFPNAKDIDTFWKNLQEGVESISFFSEQELLQEGIDSSWFKNTNYVRAGAVISDIDKFDARFFGYNPREAEIIDPQQRLFLECACEALEVAGYDSQTYSGLIGVYAGISDNSYERNNIYPHFQTSEPGKTFQFSLASSPGFLSTRVSYKLNLTGPSMTVQTACSTSLVAVHLACQSLLNGECDMALAGGVSIFVPHKTGYLYEEGMVQSPDGHCRAFDANAKGTVGGNGLGIVVLKRLEDAVASGDYIYATIKGSAVNNDGSSKVGYTAPSVEGQAAVISEAQSIAGIDPETITYIEAHGTGTPLGDPIEIAALAKVFQENTEKKGFCGIGSLKTNIGHLDAAAGVAGLIKTALALKYKQLPPTLNFETPNPNIDFANSPFYVNTTLSEWKTNGTPRRAGVSSFGIGGTNVHAVLEEAPTLEESSKSRPWQLLMLSAKTNSALETATSNLVTHLKQHPEINIADVAYTLQVGRTAFAHRRILVCQEIDDALKALSDSENQLVLTHYEEPTERPVVFMFSGQGSQYVNMAWELYQTEPTFRAQVDICSELLNPHLGIDLRYILYPETQQTPATSKLQDTAIAQSAIFVVSYALAILWQEWGVSPQGMIGHSIGEYVAATLAGVFSLEDVLALVATRGKLMQQQPPGAMLAVSLSEQECQTLLGNQLSLAVCNGLSQCVISGPTEAINTLEQQLLEKGVESRRLHTSHAFHSQMMEPVIEPFIKYVKQLSLHPPQIPYISNVTGTWITAEQATDPEYWGKHLRQTVRFADGLQELLTEANNILLEVGPGRTLTTLAKRYTGVKEQVILSSVRHPQDSQSDVAFLLKTLGQLWLHGLEIDWSRFSTHEQRHRLPLPTYPFEKQRYWIEAPKSANLSEQPISIAGELWKSLIEEGSSHASAGLLEVEQSIDLDFQEQLESLCTELMNSVLRGLGAFSNPSDKYSLEQLLEKCQITPYYQQLLSQWLTVLVERGKLKQEQELFTDLIPGSEDFIHKLLGEQGLSDKLPEHFLAENIDTYIENLVCFFKGEKEPKELLTSFWQKVPQKPLWMDYFSAIMRASIEQIVKFLPPSVNLRILEVGGGTGGATREVLPILPVNQTNYVFTDAGLYFIRKAQQEFEAYPFVEYSTLDIEKAPNTQGYSNHSFDVVIAFNVLHATQNVGESLNNVHSLLAPGGILILWEITQPFLEFCVFDGFLMNPVADGQRNQGNPFLSKEQWQEHLHTHGFVKVDVFPDIPVAHQNIIVAQVDSVATTPSAFTTTVDSKTEKVFKQKHSRPELKSNYIAPRNKIEQTIADIWQEYFGIEEVGIYDDFFELGGDSLLGAQVLSRIRKILSVELPQDKLFEKPDIASLAEEIETLLIVVQNVLPNAGETSVKQEDEERGEL